jgi:hypothetical protein
MPAPLGNKHAKKKITKSAQIPVRAFPEHAKAVKKAAKKEGLGVGDYLMACAFAHMMNTTPAAALEIYKANVLGIKPPLTGQVIRRWRMPKLE